MRERLSSIANSYLTRNQEGYFQNLNQINTTNGHISKREFLTEKQKNNFDNKFHNSKYFRGIEEILDYKEVLSMIKKIERNIIEEIYITGSILTKGIYHNDIDILILTQKNKSKFYVTHQDKKRSLTHFETIYAPINYHEIETNKNIKLITNMLKTSRRINL